MNCAQFAEILHDLDRPGTAGLSRREEALAHAESCPGCAQLLSESESLDYGLHALALRDGECEASPELELALVREFRRSRSGVKRRVAEWQIAVIGVAALALLALGVMRARIGAQTNQPTVANGVSPTSGEQYALETDAQLNELAGSEEGTSFVALPSADDTALVDGGAVVRVVMPRSALASLGLPVSGAAGPDQISAEVVVSPDGTPQAIRLISQVDSD